MEENKAEGTGRQVLTGVQKASSVVVREGVREEEASEQRCGGVSRVTFRRRERLLHRP